MAIVEDAGLIASASANHRRRTQHERRDEAERRLLDAALRIAARRGTFRMTLAEVGEEAGYSRGLATHHFGTKAKLLQAMMERIRADFQERLRLTGAPTDTLESMMQMFDTYLDGIEKHASTSRALLIMMTESTLADSELGGTVALYNREVVSAVAKMLYALQRKNHIKEGVDIESAAALIVSTLRGFMLHCLIEAAGGGVDMARVRKEVLSALRRLLGLEDGRTAGEGSALPS